MLEHVIEELEKILYETSVLKNDLNRSCEQVWNLLCPPGSQINGFKIQKEPPSSSKVESPEVSNIPSSLESILDSATELIAHGKLLRSSAQLGNKKIRGSNVSSDVKADLQNQPQANKSKTILSKEEIYSKHSNPSKVKNKPSNQTSYKKVPHVNKSLHTITNRTNSSDLEKSTKVSNDTRISQSENQESFAIAENSKFLKKDSDYLSVHTPKYSHSCSVTLSDSVKTLKIPEDMQYLLQRYYQYESHKLKNNFNKEGHNAHNFSIRINNFAKCKLRNDLRTSIKERDRYMKYLDIADEVCRGRVEKTNLGSGSIIWYETEEQLRSYEAKCQKLLELQIQTRLISVLEKYFK